MITSAPVELGRYVHALPEDRGLTATLWAIADGVGMSVGTIVRLWRARQAD